MFVVVAIVSCCCLFSSDSLKCYRWEQVECENFPDFHRNTNGLLPCDIPSEHKLYVFAECNNGDPDGMLSL